MHLAIEIERNLKNLSQHSRHEWDSNLPRLPSVHPNSVSLNIFFLLIKKFNNLDQETCI